MKSSFGKQITFLHRKKLLAPMHESGESDSSESSIQLVLPRTYGIRSTIKKTVHRILKSSEPLPTKASRSQSRRMSGPYSRKTPPPSSKSNGNRVVAFICDVCPEDVLPNILAYAGPQKVAALSKTSTRLKQLVDREATWKVLSSDFGKWNEEETLPSTTWKEYYYSNPCVPVDYETVSNALHVVSNRNTDTTIWLGTGHHHLKRRLQVDIPPGTNLRFKSIRPPEEEITLGGMQNSFEFEEDHGRRAVLSLETYKRNQPVMTIKRGNVVLEDIDVYHHCAGIADHWGGNAAICVGSGQNESNNKASLVTKNVELTSVSGWGAVACSGASVRLSGTYIHECAVGGVCMDGHDAELFVEQSDIVGNGHASRRSSSAGSGIYVRQGIAHVRNSTLSWNRGAGIHVESTDSSIKMDKNHTSNNGCEGIIVPGGTLQVPSESFRSYPRTMLMEKDSFDGEALMVATTVRERNEQMPASISPVYHY